MNFENIIFPLVALLCDIIFTFMTLYNECINVYCIPNMTVSVAVSKHLNNNSISFEQHKRQVKALQRGGKQSR